MLTPDPLAADSAPKSETITSTLLYAIQPVQLSCPKDLLTFPSGSNPP